MVLLHSAAVRRERDELALELTPLDQKPRRLEFVSLTVVSSPNHNNVTLRLLVDNEPTVLESHEGVGPIDAICGALKPFMEDVKFLRLAMVSEGPGADAIAKASVDVEWNGVVFSGESSNPNTLDATAEAIVHALDNLSKFRERIGAKSTPTVRGGLWAGFIVDEGGGTRNGNSKHYALFKVVVRACGTLLVEHIRNSTGKEKRGLAKAFHYERRICAIDVRSTSRDTCHLFIEEGDRDPCQLS